MNKTYTITSPGKTIITVDDNRLTIERKGLLNRINIGSNASKTFKIDNINSVQLKKPGLTNGYIQFGVSGDGTYKKGVRDAVNDENSVMFASNYYDDMVELKDYIDNYASPLQSVSQQANISIADELYKLKQLKDDGVISEDEFTKLKVDLLK